MEFKKTINLLDNKPNQPIKFRTKNQIKINVNQIIFKISTLRSSLCNYSDSYIYAKGTVTVTNAEAQGQRNNGSNKNVIL